MVTGDRYRCSICLRPSTISGRHLGMSEIGLTKDVSLWEDSPLVDSVEHLKDGDDNLEGLNFGKG